MALSGVILLLHLLVVWRITSEAEPGTWFGPALAVFLTGSYFPLVFWSLRGMEMGLVFLLLNLATLWLLRFADRPAATSLWPMACALACALMTRPDSAVQVAVLLGAGLLLLPRGRRAHGAAVLLGVTAVTVAGLITFRAWYFGDLLPNTYYLKMTGVTTMERVTVGLRAFVEESAPAALFLGAVASGVVFVGEARLTRVVGLLLGLALPQMLYALYVGGDFADTVVGGEGRFMAQAFGPLLIAYSLVLPRFLRPRGWNAGGGLPRESLYLFLIAGVGTAALVGGREWERWAADNAPMFQSVDVRGAKLGLLIERGTKEDAVIAVHAAGNISYYSNRRVIDLLGKSDRVIARGPAKRSFIPGHNKWNYEYALGSLRPDVIADEYPPLLQYMVRHPGEYLHLLPGGMFIRPGSPSVILDELNQNPW
jgi:hypothetical protein